MRLATVKPSRAVVGIMLKNEFVTVTAVFWDAGH